MVDPEKIYPKRLGRTKDCRLVLEYYNLAEDCFKKHAIPYDPLIPAKATVKQIYGDPKHSVYLKKVDPVNLEAVLMGQSVNVPEKYQFRPSQNFRKGGIENSVEQSPYVPIVPPVKRQEAEKQTVQIEEPDVNYDQDFEDFEASLSLGKKAPVSQPVEKQKKAKEEEKKAEEVEQTFQFIEENANGKKKEKKKEKKEKKQKKPKKEKKQAKEKKDEPPIEEEFQFL